MIEVRHLTRSFGALQALDDVSFSIDKGEVVGFLGPNGAGKTTTMRILAGYLPATSGEARVAGYDVSTQSLDVRRRIGYLPESVPLYREHRVIEMLEFQARLHGLPRADRGRRIDAVLERVGLSDRRRDLIGNLSRGLRQRAGLAVALLPDPAVLILDEPTSGLDPMQRVEVRELIRGLGAERTVLLSSHILSEIEATCPRVLIVHQGRLVADGTPDALVGRLGSASHVRMEAVLGPDPAAAILLLGKIRGVAKVIDRGRRGVHHDVDIVCGEDLREDVGALAAARGWALRELSWHRPTLEQIFARIAVGGDLSPRPDREPDVASTRVVEPSAQLVPLEPARPGANAAAKPRAVYNLNPFDRGATRDLSAPKAVDSGESGARRADAHPGDAARPRAE